MSQSSAHLRAAAARTQAQSHFYGGPSLAQKRFAGLSATCDYCGTAIKPGDEPCPNQVIDEAADALAPPAPPEDAS